MTYKLPCRVNDSLSILLHSQRDAGWAVLECTDREHALQVMATYPRAEMPCWRRIRSGEP